MSCNNKEKDTCVCVNIFVNCDDDKDRGERSWEKKEYKDDDCCVKVNIFADCKDEKCHKEKCC